MGLNPDSISLTSHVILDKEFKPPISDSSLVSQCNISYLNTGVKISHANTCKALTTVPGI